MFLSFSSAKKTQKNKGLQLFKPIKGPIYQKQAQELKEFKKDLALVNSKENLQKKAILESKKVEDIYKLIDASYEKFFLKREYDLKNFNFWITILGIQKQENTLENVLKRMTDLGLQPNRQTYINLIQAYGRIQNKQFCEQYYEQSVASINQLINKLEEFGKSIQLFNSLLFAYGRCRDIKQVQKTFNEMVDSGIKPDTIAYTTLINCYYKIGNLQKCWDLFTEMRMGETSTELDENIFNLMIEISSHTHDAEKAIGLFNMMAEFQYLNTPQHYNSYIKALASRRDYAQKALEVYQQMINTGIQIDSDTIVHTLKACSQLGDVKTAYNVLQLMKSQEIPNNQYIQNMTIKVYAGAVKLNFLEEETKELFIQDAWVQFEQAKKNGWITSHTLDAMALIMVNAHKLADLEGLVFPLYDELKIPKTPLTYESVIKIMFKDGRYLDVFRLKDVILSNNMSPTYNTICLYLESGIKLADLDKIIDALEMFQQIKRTPKTHYLKFLGEQDPLPPRLHAILYEFEPKFGLVKDKVLREQKKDKHLPN